MPIPGPGTAISLNTIAAEFGGTVPHSINEYYRGGPLVNNSPANAAIPTSGQISLSNFYGASSRVAISLPITGTATTYNVFDNRGPLYVPGISDITVTVGPAGVVGGTLGGTYAMLVPNQFSPTDTVTIVNNGTIAGAGGNGGTGGNAIAQPFPTMPKASGSSQGPGQGSTGIAAQVGAPGGGAASGILVQRPVIITNNGTIAAGGGGGGGGAGRATSTPNPPGGAGPPKRSLGGGGGGGGAGSAVGLAGAGGTANFSGLNVNQATQPGPAGSNGTLTTGGAGGPGRTTAIQPGNPVASGNGGVGGSLGAAGSAGTGGSGRTLLAAPPNLGRTVIAAGGPGGATANYIVGNPFVTWNATGTRLGGVA